MYQHTLLLLAAILAAFVAGCEQPRQNDPREQSLPGWVGKNVRVQFRRDALGASSELPISPKTGEINGASTTIVGKLLTVQQTSIVVEESERPKWIPREVILFVELNP